MIAEDASTLSRGDADRAAVRPHALGAAASEVPLRLAALDRIGERLARRLRALVEPLVSTKVTVAAEPIETLRFDAWRAGLPHFTSISLYRARPFKNGIAVAVEPAFVGRLVDAFYGGSGLFGRAKMREFTPTEDHMLARFVDGLIDHLVEAWREFLPIEAQLAARETNSEFASLVRPDEGVVVQRYAITAGAAAPSTVAVIYPLAALRACEAQLSTKVHEEVGTGDAAWRVRLGAALETVRLPVRSVLARPELSLAQLLELKVGDVIPITLEPKAPLIVAERKMALGTIGEREGRAAFMVEQVFGRDGER